jgi:hypothetical protein
MRMQLFVIFGSTKYRSLLDIRTVIIRYLQRRNEPILNAFKNNFDPFLVFLSCFENII